MAPILILLVSLLHSPAAGNPVRSGGQDEDGDGWPEGWDCDDTHAETYPDAPEVCDGMDNDCDALVDEGVRSPFVPTPKGWIGACYPVRLLAAPPEGTVWRCDQPVGYLPTCRI